MPAEVGSVPSHRLVLDILELRRHTGSRRPFAAVTDFDDLQAGEFRVRDGRVAVDFVIEAVTEGIAVSGTVRGEWTGPCRRCLDPVVDRFDTPVREIFERDPTEGETWPIDDDRIDLAPMVREAALLSLPLAPLCREDCEGPAPERFPATAPTGSPDSSEAAVRDPRWAALDVLRTGSDDTGSVPGD